MPAKRKRGGRGYVAGDVKAIAHQRIDVLFDIAEKAAMCREFGWARRYVTLAKKIGMRATIGIPKRWRAYYCRHCLSFLLPPHNATVRINNGMITKKCLHCGKVRRVPFSGKGGEHNERK